MLADEIKKQMMAALKAHDTVTKEVLRTALGEIQMTGMKEGRDLTDEETAAIVRKLVKSNEETLAVATNEEQKRTLVRENEVLRALLPKSLGVADIVAALAPVADAVRAAGNDGQATGVAMKHLKAQGARVEGKDVSAAVKQLRS